MTTPDAATMAERTMPQNGSTQEPNGGTTEKPVQRVKQSEVVEGGSPNLEIWLDPTTQKLVTDRLSNRLQISNVLSSKERPLATVDRVIQRLGPDAVARLEKGDLTRKDLAIAVFVLRDELLQKSLAAGKTIKDIKTIETTRLGKIPFFRRIVENSSLKTQLDASKSQSTEYTREIGFDQWTTDHIENDLVALNQLRTSVELSFYGRHIDDPLFDQDSISLHTAGRKTGNRLHDAVVDELTGEEGILKTRFGGRTLLELSQEDPIAATQAVFEANQRALTQFAGETAKDLLKAESPTADTELIEKQAQRVEAKPTQEDLTKAQEAAEKATAEFTNAEVRLNALNAPVEAAETILLEKQLAYNKAKQNFEQISVRQNPEIQRLGDRVELLYNSIQEPDPSLTPEQKADVQRATATTSQNIARIEAIIQSYQDKLNQLLQQQIDAELDLNQQTENAEKAKKNASDKGLDAAKKDFDAKKEAKEKADSELREKQKAGETGISEEAKEKAKGLRKWKEVVAGYDKIIDTRFSQKYTDEYSRESMADIEETPDGQIKGAERIREHIFRVVNPEDYDPALARKMLNNQTMAKAIAWVYKIDSSLVTNPDGSLSLKKALPYLRSSQFQVGDLLRFVVSEGVKSAEHGNPYLELDKYYETPKPELKLEAESIYGEGVGEALVDKADVEWTGEVINPKKLDGFERNDLPLTYLTTLNFDRAQKEIFFNTYIQVNERLIESLPRVLNDSLPQTVKELYDPNTKLLNRDRIKFNEWIKIEWDQDNADSIDTLFTSFEDYVGKDVPKNLKIAVANCFLDMNSSKRLESLKGFALPVEVRDVKVTVRNADGNWDTVSKNYNLDFDNTGNFYIIDTATGEKQELSSFYKRELDNFRESRYNAGLGPEDRKTLQEQSFFKVQEVLGEAILRAQMI